MSKVEENIEKGAYYKWLFIFRKSINTFCNKTITYYDLSDKISKIVNAKKAAQNLESHPFIQKLCKTFSIYPYSYNKNKTIEALDECIFMQTLMDNLVIDQLTPSDYTFSTDSQGEIYDSILGLSCKRIYSTYYKEEYEKQERDFYLKKQTPQNDQDDEPCAE